MRFVIRCDEVEGEGSDPADADVIMAPGVSRWGWMIE